MLDLPPSRNQFNIEIFASGICLNPNNNPVCHSGAKYK
ncbi:unnamed protein product [Acanthoscelides obtectus]|uniref:Uncharacterized protein n=1 Tax=Acanthoscelides obtectus TaxID=200917 RepID=A0A9P0NQA0_ACAOB|nr:unnamed protein product [Acanthoscelides obtectus]CAK1678687.1 hypothetical protein AOBTE_LOCUS31998 [Acanthoscelides obtectus]